MPKKYNSDSPENTLLLHHSTLMSLAFTDSLTLIQCSLMLKCFLLLCLCSGLPCYWLHSSLFAVQWLWIFRHPGSRWTWTRVASYLTVAVVTCWSPASCAASRPTLTQRTREEALVMFPPSWLYEWVVTYWITFLQSILISWLNVILNDAHSLI